VAAFESRQAAEMAQLIARHGGVPLVSPSMREVPLAENPEAIDFAHRVITGEIDVVIFMTGVGARHLVAQVERRVERERFLNALADMRTVARGPKPVAALKEFGVQPTLRVPEPNTWREVLKTLDAQLPVASLVVAVQEYGIPNPSLVAGLEARGATVVTVPVYTWELPLDTAPLEENVRRLAGGEVDVALFTSATQVEHVVKVAEGLELGEKLREASRRIVFASVGPTTSDALREHELPVDLEPPHPKMGTLVQAAAQRAGEIRRRKEHIQRHVLMAAPRERGGSSETKAAWHDSPFLRACRREPADHTPVWLMRQAGRYLPEYRAVREKVSFLELCRSPQLASEVMCRAVEYLGVDAAIIFSDLLPILEPMGMDLEFTKGDGPVIHNPVREAEDVDRVIELESVDSLHFVMETVCQTRADLPDHLPLIGFAGAPFTLASYAIEGGGSRNYLFTKTLMYRDRGAWDALMSRFVRAVSLYLGAQITAGAQAVQLFDSWVGCLGVEDYRTYVLPHVARLLAALPGGVPVIHFGTGNPALLPHMAEAGGDVIGVDWRVPLDVAWREFGPERAVQGNLDPAVLLAGKEEIEHRAREVLNQAGGRPGHIFNLGHGVLPQTPPENARRLVQVVKTASAR
jgi:uroporphyrinogen decarboxylase